MTVLRWAAILGLLFCGVMLPRPAAADTKLVIGQTAAHDYQPAIIAKEKGFFAKRGFDVEIMIPPQPSAVFGGITSGSIQIGTSPGPQIALANDAGADVVVVSGGAFETRAHPSIIVVASPAANIRQASDFRGKKVMTPGLNSVYHVMFQQWLILQGVDPKAVVFPEGGFPQMADMLKAALIDAALPTEPFTSRILDSGSGVHVADYFSSVKDDAFVTFYIATKAWAAENPAALHAFREALAEGIAFIRANDMEAKAIEAQFLKLPPPLLAKLGPPNAKIEVTADDLQFWLDSSKSLGLVATTLDAKSMMAP
jgi:NitT/TauT family transport system substrate-binding protein